MAVAVPPTHCHRSLCPANRYQPLTKDTNISVLRLLIMPMVTCTDTATGINVSLVSAAVWSVEWLISARSVAEVPDAVLTQPHIFTPRSHSRNSKRSGGVGTRIDKVTVGCDRTLANAICTAHPRLWVRRGE